MQCATPTLVSAGSATGLVQSMYAAAEAPAAAGYRAGRELGSQQHSADRRACFEECWELLRASWESAGNGSAPPPTYNQRRPPTSHRLQPALVRGEDLRRLPSRIQVCEGEGHVLLGLQPKGAAAWRRSGAETWRR